MAFKKLAIRFGDNDFSGTFVHLLENIGQSSIPQSAISREELCTLINRASAGIYLIHQARWDMHRKYDWEWCQVDVNKNLEYLQIKPERILLDDEVDNYIKERNGDDNGETFVLDMTGTKPVVRLF